MQPARAQRIASQTIRAPCNAAQRIASHPVQRSAPRECNQPATHRPPRPLRIIRCTAHTSHLQRLHALRSTLRWFRLVRGTNFSKIQFIYIANFDFVMCS
jgi:hypothetical protein